MKYKESLFLNKWVNQTIDILLHTFKVKPSKKKVEKYLWNIIKKNLVLRKTNIINNYVGSLLESNLLEVVDMINTHHLIMGGGGCLYLPHKENTNILVDFIIDKMEARKKAKKERSLYKKGSFEWLMCDIRQNNIKLVINALYGILGYSRSILFNLFIAESVTTGGRHIITTAINTFETFLADSVGFVCPGELYTFLYNVRKEFKEKDYKEKIDLANFTIPSVDDVSKRLSSSCKFELSDSLKEYLECFVKGLSPKQRLVFYYKNNLNEFNQQPLIQSMYRYIVSNNGPLLFSDMNLLKDDAIRSMVNELKEYYNIFVIYNYPSYDRLRKGMYLDKYTSLYTDTDSVFVSVNRQVKYVESLFNSDPSQYPLDKNTLTFTSANLTFIFINDVIDKALKKFCYSTNVPYDFAQMMGMKNEFFFSRIVFLMAKKRYLALAMLQEGTLLNNGKGLAEIKGVDFIKATTKPSLKEYYIDIVMKDILTPEEIKPHIIFQKMIRLRKNIEQSIRSGDRIYFKQLSVKTADIYKNPYSTQGVVATMLWNVLCPQYTINLPADIDILPIKDITYPKPKNGKASLKTPLDNKTILDYSIKYPNEYDRLYKEIYTNEDAMIRHMGLKSIAIPRNEDVVIPDCVYELVDFDKIIDDSVRLFLPVMVSLGMTMLPVSASRVDMTNLVHV